MVLSIFILRKLVYKKIDKLVPNFLKYQIN